MLELWGRWKRRRAGLERGGKPSAQEAADSLHKVFRAQGAEVLPDRGIFRSSTLELQRPAVMGQGCDEHRAGSFAAAIVPGEEVVPS